MERIESATVDDRIVPLHEGDANAGLRLSTEAGWNQTVDDWRLLLRFGRGFGVRTVTGTLIASIIALPYAPSVGWIGMLLVDSSCRRRGLASRLMLRTIDQLRSMGLVPMLDATPAGKLVYERLGFVEVGSISRWRRANGLPPSLNHATSGDLSMVLAVDRQAFGAHRSHLLRSFVERPGSTLLVDTGRSGYALSRLGQEATHIGPIVTLDPARQPVLMEAMLDVIRGPVIVDIPDNAIAVRDAMLAAGFEIERPFTRMALGSVDALSVPRMVAAIAGPEFG